ncbi:MAG: SMP-30/gluconolactonase/LRE family protein [Alphaproteobacteria bacterium]|jgi:gluconolactonase|nr:SMP-30/gluconolactonase/LRE family protein [Alphaproteobacteria bacterium]MBN9556019.1 SMP-30/gluconolactonase/LRE family protein [Alphaproteobacteria bacterium]MBN9566841.1 SMP-30/gluconolactonase/LRE family protein [Alphaproteobacteria bacterium]MBN9577311.1 SMP-30/gluconolactonase/LRE family protein [Alphaproteobacteria bacterium]MBN9593331.1 SMP-30/gluconolactonase/LRE family protein [Alphaproteobacteria bacterium]
MQFREITSGLRFPEGPVAMDDGSVIVVEMAAARISRVTPDGKIKVIAEPGGGPNGLAIGPDGALYVCNNGGNFEVHERDGLLIPGHTPASHKGGRIERVNLSTGKVEVVYDKCDGVNLGAPNDIVFDTAGGMWFTDHGSTNEKYRTHGALFYAKADGSKITKVLHELLSPNGVGLSPDGKIVHYAETFPARLWGLPLTAPGQAVVNDGFTPANFEGNYPGLAYFDSLGVQADGGVCVATILAGGISTFWPASGKFEHTALPDILCTNICWGGKDMKTAFVTMSSTGKLAAMEWRSPGLRLNYNA